VSDLLKVITIVWIKLNTLKMLNVT